MAGPKPHLATMLDGLTPSATVAINERSDALRAQGRDIIKFGLGQSPFPVPSTVVSALQSHAAEKDYLQVQGLLALREVVARFHARRDGIDGRGADDVVVGPGSKELLFLLQLVYGADLVIPRPAWVSYAPQAKLLNRPCHQIETDPSDGWRLTPDGLDQLCTAQGTRPRILILNYPCNPTGLTLDKDRLMGIAEVARKHDIVVLSDEIYGEIHHDGAHVSIARFYPEGTIVSAGLSKWCGAGGWRLGTFLFPPELRWLKEALTVAASETFTSVSAPIQHAAITAFEENPEIDEYLHRSRKVLKALGLWCAQRLRQAGAHCPDPEGGFYLLPDFTPLADALSARGIQDSAGLCRALLDDTGVAVLPGTDFGRSDDEFTIRMAYVDFDGAGALDAAHPDVALDLDWLTAHCPRVIDGINRMVGWLAP